MKLQRIVDQVAAESEDVLVGGRRQQGGGGGSGRPVASAGTDTTRRPPAGGGGAAVGQTSRESYRDDFDGGDDREGGYAHPPAFLAGEGRDGAWSLKKNARFPK